MKYSIFLYLAFSYMFVSEIFSQTVQKNNQCFTSDYKGEIIYLTLDKESGKYYCTMLEQGMLYDQIAAMCDCFYVSRGIFYMSGIVSKISFKNDTIILPPKIPLPTANVYVLKFTEKEATTPLLLNQNNWCNTKKEFFVTDTLSISDKDGRFSFITDMNKNDYLVFMIDSFQGHGYRLFDFKKKKKQQGIIYWLDGEIIW